jgi:hypothetical protein
MSITIPNVISTPVGASSSVAGMVSLIANVILPPVWPWWAHTDQSWRGAVVTVLIFVLSYLGAWLKIVTTPGQKSTMSLTSSPLPTMQETPATGKA